MTSSCKYMRSKYNFTPSDFDLYFDYTEVPSNIDLQDAVNLTNQLQQVMPLTKVIHLHLEVSEKNYSQFLNVHTQLKIKNKEIRII